MIDFVVTGQWNEGDVISTNVATRRHTTPEVDAIIARTWEEIAAEPGVHLFDGPTCRLESWRVAGERLELELSPSSYKIFLGTNLHHPELATTHGRAAMANPAGLAPALVTSDGQLLMGRRNASVAYYPDRVHPFAGALEPKDGGDVFVGMRRELSEELGLARDEIRGIVCAGIAEDRGLMQPEFLFIVETARTAAELVRRVEAAEHRGHWQTPATQAAVDKVLADPKQLTPIALASLLLWGRRELGTAWFERSAAAVGATLADPQSPPYRRER